MSANWDKERGTRIKELRKDKDFTQATLAQQIGVGSTLVSKWERGRGISHDNLKVLAQVLDTSMSYILEGKENKDAETYKKITDLIQQTDNEYEANLVSEITRRWEDLSDQLTSDKQLRLMLSTLRDQLSTAVNQNQAMIALIDRLLASSPENKNRDS